MPQYLIRSTIFNLCFYILTGLSCILLLPTLILPRQAFMAVVHGFVYTTAFLEKYILGLSYEVRGREHIPASGAYIVAAKHQSAYETFKLHILFSDPAIVLKRELLKIPLWGNYLAKSDVIAIDRSSPKLAIKSIQDGAQRMAAMGREIIIFPQGTRVSPQITAAQKPYKIGIIRMQEATNLPIIPMALNTGMFYPRQGWCKKPGRVVFEFLPAIEPADDAAANLKALETVLEAKSNALMDEALAAQNARRKSKISWLVLPLLCLVYSGYWFYAAHLTQNAVVRFLDDLTQNPSFTKAQLTPPSLSGFPFKLTLSFGAQSIETPDVSVDIEKLTAQSWPILGFPIDITSGKLSVKMQKWTQNLDFDKFEGQITHRRNILNIKHAYLLREDFKSGLSGEIDFNTQPYPDIDLILTLENHAAFLMALTQRKIIKEKPAMFAMAALTAMERDGIVTTTISRQNDIIYLGPIRIAQLPRMPEEGF